MKSLNKVPIFTAIIFSLCINLTQGQSVNWVWAYGSTGTGTENPFDMTMDNFGNTYVTGDFSGNAVFGTFNLTSSGSTDIFIVKYDKNGQAIWAQKAGGSGYDCGKGITRDNEGNLYIAGYFNSTAYFGNLSVITAGGYDGFVAKYSPDGIPIWVKPLGGKWTDIIDGIVINNENQICIAGDYEDTAKFGSKFSLFAPGYNDFFIAKMDTAGSFLDVVGSQNSNILDVIGLAVDQNDNLYLVGEFRDTLRVEFHTWIVGTKLKMMLLKFRNDLTWLDCNISTGTNASSYPHDISYKDGKVMITGTFEGTTSFGSKSLISKGLVDVFVAVYDTIPRLINAYAAGSTNYDQGFSVLADDIGNIYVTGFHNDGAKFGTTTLHATDNDVFVAKINSAGNWEWAIAAGGISYDNGMSLGLYNDQIIICGIYYESIKIGNTTLTGSGSTDFNMFLAGVGIPPPPSVIITQHPQPISACEGDDVEFSVAAKGKNLKYQWYKNGLVIPATDSFLKLNLILPSKAGIYKCEVSDSIMSVFTNDASLVVNTAPSITVQPLDKSVKKGQNVTFSISATGGSLMYQWKKNGNNIAGANQSNYSFVVINYNDSGRYSCQVFNTCDTIYSREARLGITNSILNNSAEGIIKIFPNPSSGIYHFTTDLKEKGIYKIEIYNSLGEIVWSDKLVKADQTIDIAKCPAGIYHLILYKEGEIYNSKIIKQ
jgi:hypothetical protein